MDKRNKEIGKLLYEKHLFEINGNTHAAERIDELIQKIREEKGKEIAQSKVKLAG